MGKGMLVLSRFKDQTIIVGEGENAVTITVVDIRGDRVRLGVCAPKHIPVHRKEIAERIERQAAAETKPPPTPPPPVPWVPLAETRRERIDRLVPQDIQDSIAACGKRIEGVYESAEDLPASPVSRPKLGGERAGAL